MGTQKTSKKILYPDFNPNDAAVPGKIFGLPHTEKEAAITLIPIPSAITVSGSSGAENGPEGLLRGSEQIELFNKSYPKDAWRPGIFMREVNPLISGWHKEGRNLYEKLHELLEIENPSPATKNEIKKTILEIDACCNQVNQEIEFFTTNALNAGKIVGLLGGCHGSVFGGIKAVAKKFPNLTVVHIDAHHDLRNAFKNLKNSHASIMRNVLEEIPEVERLVSIGIRSYGEDEYQYAQENKKRVRTWYADDIWQEIEEDKKSFRDIARNIEGDIDTNDVYISFDIDSLEPCLCPSTGTPVPGGFSVNQAKMLIDAIAKEKRIVGFDLNEVVPNHRIDELVGAEILYHLCVRTMESQWIDM